MSIRTRCGDRGETDLLYSRRVPKSDFRIAAVGAVDEASSALGLARVCALGAVAEEIARIQRELIALMGELAVEPGDMGRYEQDGHQRVGEEQTGWLDEAIDQLEATLPAPEGWVIPGEAGSELGARFDFARSVVRRAERDVVDLAETEPTLRPELLAYLNRLGDLLWLRAREAEAAESDQ